VRLDQLLSSQATDGKEVQEYSQGPSSRLHCKIPRQRYWGSLNFHGILWWWRPPPSSRNRLIPEDTIWHYFLQILQALHHFHHPNGRSRSWSGSTVNGAPIYAEGGSRRVQIFHRDHKRDNGSSSSTTQTVVSLIIHYPPGFLDENNTL
jgi:serine/threonine protein kinase